MDYKEPKQSPEPKHAEQPKAKEASCALAAQGEDSALTGAVAAMAASMAGLMEPADAAALKNAAATLVKGGDDGDA